MAYLNKCMFIGNVGREPQVRSLNSGSKVANFSIAVSKRYRDRNGEQKDKTDWVSCTAFGKLAEVVESLVDKGSQLYVEGEFNVENYTDANGTNKQRTFINVGSLQVLSGFKEKGSSESFDDDEDIPF